MVSFDMHRWSTLALAAITGIWFAGGATAAEPYLRIGLLTWQKGETPQDPDKWFSYAPEIEHEEDKVIRLFADANVPSAFLVLAIDPKTKDVSPEWVPRLVVHEKRFSEVQFPSAADGIPCSPDLALDLFVVSIPLSHQDLESITETVQRLEKAARDPGQKQVFALQAARLREKVEDWFRRQNKEESVAQYRAPAKAATVRSVEKVNILWREKDLVHKFTNPAPDSPLVVRFPLKAQKGN